MPLAIELAAARVGSLPVEAIAARLDDRFKLLTGGARDALPRQQTLRAALDWSYDLLSEGEQRLLDRLSVFAGGCTLEAAEAVCTGPGVEAWEVLDLLGSLASKSLLLLEDAGPEDGQGRYRLLETVRQYGWERLAAGGEAAAVRDRHLDWCVGLAEQTRIIEASARSAWLRRLEAEQDNLRAALHWCTAGMGRPEAGLQVATTLGYLLWGTQGPGEGRHWLETLLAKGGSVSAQVRARALAYTGSLASIQGDLQDAQARLEASLALFRDLGDSHGSARALANLSIVALLQGYAGRARALSEEALALFRELGDEEDIAAQLNDLGVVANRQADPERAVMLLQESLMLARKLGLEDGSAVVRLNLGAAACLRGAFEQARSLLEESLPTLRRNGNRWLISENLIALGDAALFQGDYGQAREYYEESLSLLHDLGALGYIGFPPARLGLLTYLQGDTTRAGAVLREGLVLARDRGALWAVAACLEGLAALDGAGETAERAVRLFGAASALRETLDVPLPQPEHTLYYDQAVADLRTALGEEAFVAAWAEGRALSLEEAIALALEVNHTP
jgi:tetratricopeptide (TPR) repeat protein